MADMSTIIAALVSDSRFQEVLAAAVGAGVAGVGRGGGVEKKEEVVAKKKEKEKENFVSGEVSANVEEKVGQRAEVASDSGGSDGGKWFDMCENTGKEAAGSGSESGRVRGGREDVVIVDGSVSSGCDSVGSERSVVAVGKSPGVVAEKQRFYAQYVRVPVVEQYAGFVREKCGWIVPRGKMALFAVCGYAKGTMPGAFADGKKRLGQFTQVGDRYLSFAAVKHEVVVRDGTAEDCQNLLNSRAGNMPLVDAFHRHDMVRFVRVPTNVDLRASKIGADAVEALVGFVVLHIGYGAADRLVASLGLLEKRVTI